MEKLNGFNCTVVINQHVAFCIPCIAAIGADNGKQVLHNACCVAGTVNRLISPDSGCIFNLFADFTEGLPSPVAFSNVFFRSLDACLLEKIGIVEKNKRRSGERNGINIVPLLPERHCAFCEICGIILCHGIIENSEIAGCYKGRSRSFRYPVNIRCFSALKLEQKLRCEIGIGDRLKSHIDIDAFFLCKFLNEAAKQFKL